MSRKILLALIIAFGLTGSLLIGQILFGNAQRTDASVSLGSDYHSTSTASGFVNNSVLLTGPGTFGSVVITTPGTGTITFYDGTTTLAHPDWATTTLAQFNASTPAGTYTFDAIVIKGLIMQYTGVLASSTVTFR